MHRTTAQTPSLSTTRSRSDLRGKLQQKKLWLGFGLAVIGGGIAILGILTVSQNMGSPRVNLRFHSADTVYQRNQPATIAVEVAANRPLTVQGVQFVASLPPSLSSPTFRPFDVPGLSPIVHVEHQEDGRYLLSVALLAAPNEPLSLTKTPMKLGDIEMIPINTSESIGGSKTFQITFDRTLSKVLMPGSERNILVPLSEVSILVE